MAAIDTSSDVSADPQEPEGYLRTGWIPISLLIAGWVPVALCEVIPFLCAGHRFNLSPDAQFNWACGTMVASFFSIAIASLAGPSEGPAQPFCVIFGILSMIYAFLAARHLTGHLQVNPSEPVLCQHLLIYSLIAIALVVGAAVLEYRAQAKSP